MTEIEALLEELRDLGIRLSAHSGRLRLNAPVGALTAELRAKLLRHKPELLDLLHKQQGRLYAATIERVSRDGPLPLSHAQQRIWFMDQLHPDTNGYIMVTAHRLLGPLDHRALRGSLDDLVRRHESLRTAFLAADGVPQQMICDSRSADFRLVDLRQYSASRREMLARKLIGEEQTRSFDLAVGALMRATLMRLDERDHVLLLALHHIVSDGWSLGLIKRELSILYTAHVEEAEVRLPTLAIQYADFAVWQRKHGGSDWEVQLQYWTRQLANLEPLKIPSDLPRPARQTFHGACVRHVLSKQLGDAIADFNRSENATLFMTMLTAFMVLLRRYSGEYDIAVGCPTANRNRPEVERLIGCFVNPLVIRSDLTGNPSFRDLVSRVRQVALDAQQRQDIPFEHLVQRLQPERELSRNPLFQVLFAVQNADSEQLTLAGTDVANFESDVVTTRFDLELHVIEIGQCLEATFVYNTGLFRPATIERMLEHYCRLLAAAIKHPDGAIDTLPILSNEERHQLLLEWNDTSVEYPHQKCVHQLFEEQVRKSPDAVAVLFEGQHVTYRQLNEQANQLAHRLRGLGVRSESLVGLCIERSLDLVVGILGIVKAGGAYLPLDPELPTKRLEFMLQDAAVECLVTRHALLSQLPSLNCQTVCLDADKTTLSLCPIANPKTGVDGKNLAYVMYTSGSTGSPKGVAIRHSSVVNLLTAIRPILKIRAGTRFLGIASPTFDISVAEMFLPLVAGGTAILVSEQTARDVSLLTQTIVASQPDVIQATPATWSSLLDSGWPGSGAADLISTGEALPEAVGKRLLHLCRRLWDFYGPTETTIWSTIRRVTSERIAGSIGRPIANTSVYILDQHQQPVPVGVFGELYVGGAGLARGYLNRPELTAEKFVGHSFSDDPAARLYRTGDLCRWLADGTLELVGRMDHQVKLRGFRIELGEIEALLRDHPSVTQCVVVLREDRPGDKRLVAYYLPVAAGNLNFTELARYLERRLPNYMVPAAFVALDALPLTPSGKIDRRTLPVPDYSRPELESSFTPPRNPLEEQLTSIWYELLGVERIGVHDNFFALGGHSLLVAQLVSRLRLTFQVELPLSAVFATPTVADLAEAISQARQSSEGMTPLPPIESVVREQPLPLSFAQQRLWFLDQLGAGAAYNMLLQLRRASRIDESVLRRVLMAVANRHETLRTTFGIDDGRPYLRIAPALEVPLEIVDLADLPIEAAECECMRLAREHLVQPFDLAEGPLVRALLVRMRHEDALSIAIHHSICDGWSLRVLQEEISEHYRAFGVGDEPRLPALPIQYPDYAVWQNQWLDGDALGRQMAYWQRKLGGQLPVLALPTDRPRPKVQTFGGASCPFDIPLELCQDLTQFNRKRGVTMATTLLTAFKLLLARYTGQEEIVIGSPIAGRNRLEIEGLIGFFVNSLVLRTDLSGDPSFEAAIERVHQVALEAYDQQDVPFERLVDVLAPERDLTQNPLFQVVFAMQYGMEQPDNLATSDPALNFRVGPIDVTVTRTDIELHLFQHGDRITGQLVYNTALFDASTIDRMVDHYRRLIQSAMAHPAERVSRLKLLSDEERHLLLTDWNRTDMPFPEKRCIHELFEAAVKNAPDALSLVFEDRQMTYGQLNAAANQVAHTLRAMGVKPDAVIGLCVERCPEMIVGLLGILKAGGAYVPIDPAYPRERLAFMLKDSATAVLVTQAHLVETLPEHSAQCLCLDRDVGAIAAAPTENPELVTTPQNLAYVIYTSGSTGRPKGTLLAHRGLVSLSEEQSRSFGVDAASRVLQFSSLSFDASTFEVMMALPKGATLVLGDRQALLPGPDLHRFLMQHRVSIITLPPTALAALPAEELPDLATITVAGEACSAELVSRWAPGRRFFNLYGPTEATIWSTTAELRAGEASHIGRPIGNVTTYVLDSEGGVVPVGVAGELTIGGIGVARGYLGRPDLTAERFVPDPFSSEPGARLYRSGDVVRWRHDGNLEFVGRIDDQVKLRGYRIELGEIEAVLDEHPAVRESVVVVREVGAGDRRLVAYVRCEEDVELVSAEKDVSQWQQDHVTQWQSVYDQSYSAAEEPAEAAFQISGWNSSYTGEAIPAYEMRAWVDETVASIRATGAERVIEMGCGSGLMLLNLVGSCAEYHASDFSQPALNYIAAQLERMPEQAPKVVLERRTAENFSGIPAGRFDTVVLNSVVQYFPDAAYLREVLTGAVRTVRPGGRVFVGDVRSMPLMDAFHASVQLFRSPGETSREQLRQRVRHERNQDQELVVDPLFFNRLAAELGSITHVEMRPKRGRYDNELSRFRFDVVLHVGEPGSVTIAELDWRPWSAQELTLERLRALLKGQGPEILALSSIANQRVARDVGIVTLLQEEASLATAAALSIAADAFASESAAVEPEDFWDLAESLGYDAYLSVANGRADGAFDTVLVQRGQGVPAESIWAAMPVHEGLPTGAPLTNRPLRGRFLRELVPHLRKFAGDRLPEYMVPSVFTVVDTFPVLPSGKVDRRALPAPDSLRPELAVDYEGPRSVLEETLAGIWMQVLGVDRVGVRDNFFELGGDSMLSIQVVAAAREAGIAISARNVFEHQTVEDLAAAAGTSVASAQQGAVSGEMLLTPIASWFFEHDLIDRHHFNQAFFLNAAQPVDRVQLEETLFALVQHHDALRIRARRTDAGWQQTIAAPGEAVALDVVDLSGLPDDELDARVETEAARVQASLDLAEGPVLRCALLKCGAARADKLLIVIHHLAIDVVSWGILLDDVARGLDQRRSGAPVRLPPKTTSMQQWARRVNEYAGSADVARGARFWLEQPWDRVHPLTIDVPNGENTIGTMRTVSCALDDELTRVVLHEIPNAFNATVEDVLLAALAFAMASATGSEHVAFDLEGHGRQEFADDLDVSRTVGWFTAIHPVLLEVPPNASAGGVLRSVKEQLRAVPGKGFAFGLARYLSPDRALSDQLAALPSAEVIFNYLGNLDRMIARQGSWIAAVSGASASRSPRGERTHLLEVTAGVPEGRLQVNFDYSTGVHREETVRRLADQYRSALNAFTDAARSGSEAGFTESDLAEVGWDADDIEELLTEEEGGRERP